jgi:hypothetical protein
MKFKTVFLIADDRPDESLDSYAFNSVICPKELPVTLDFHDHNIIGAVSVKENDKEFEGEFTIPETQYIQKGLMPYLVPAISGYIIDSEMKADGKRIITRCKVNAVSLVIGRNCDDRIKRLKDVEIED